MAVLLCACRSSAFDHVLQVSLIPLHTDQLQFALAATCRPRGDHRRLASRHPGTIGAHVDIQQTIKPQARSDRCFGDPPCGGRIIDDGDNRGCARQAQQPLNIGRSHQLGGDQDA